MKRGEGKMHKWKDSSGSMVKERDPESYKNERLVIGT